MQGGVSGGSGSKSGDGDGMASGNLNNNPGDPPACHNNGNNMGDQMGGSGGYRLASDPLPPVHSLGLGVNFGTNNGNGGGLGGSFLRYDPRQTEALLDVCVGGGGGGHLGNDPLLLPLPSPESLLELAELYRDDPPSHEVETPQPDPPPLLAPLTPMEPSVNSTQDNCVSSRGHDVKFDISGRNSVSSQFVNRNATVNSLLDNHIQGKYCIIFKH